MGNHVLWTKPDGNEAKEMFMELAKHIMATRNDYSITYMDKDSDCDFTGIRIDIVQETNGS